MKLTAEERQYVENTYNLELHEIPHYEVIDAVKEYREKNQNLAQNIINRII